MKIYTEEKLKRQNKIDKAVFLTIFAALFVAALFIIGPENTLIIFGGVAALGYSVFLIFKFWEWVL